MSKPVKNLIIESYKQRFADVTGAVLIDIRGIEANENNTLRNGLAEKQIRVTVVKNSLAKKAFEGTDLESVDELLEGSAAMVYPTDGDVTVVNVAREMVDWAKKLPKLEFKGAIMDGILFGPDQVEDLSKYPTREEAQAQTVQLLLSPAQNLVGAITGPGKKVASLIEAIREKLESGEEIKAA
ncbi:MAG: 50S ribosomal protein L10 [Phycisphaeraceae bacterium]